MGMREDFVAAVMRLIGTPVVHRGRVAGVALDCVGVPKVALSSLGIPIRLDDVYGRFPKPDQLLSGLADYCNRVAVSDRAPGDVLALYAGRQPRHVAVHVGVNECGQDLAVGARDSVVSNGPVQESAIHSVWRLRCL